MDMQKLLDGKSAVVTGGTRGIGFSIVERYLQNGAKVALFGSRQETVDKALQKLTQYGDSVLGLCPDLCDPQAVADAFENVRSTFGSLDILANNAGISSNTPLDSVTLEEFRKIMDLNVVAPFVCSQAAYRIMKPQGGGVIINTSSMVSGFGQAAGVGYPVSKFAINGMTISLARELGKDGIRVNAVAPGVTMTDMVSALPKPVVDRITAAIPLGRPGEPEDVANAFVFLASDLASYVSGTILHVDGAVVV